ncbi:MAG: hypothetical protein COB15_16830 [Flavobacteriales bacterium]|nr:MAG: hypothetical protein COB15_16830 [Flavobacteriales bacterium]
MGYIITIYGINFTRIELVKLFLASTFLLLNFLSIAQELNYTNYSTHNGLPSAQVYHMHQDKNGYIWFATDRGIARYDGKEFEQYSLTEGLTGTTVFAFYPQQNGDIWCSTFNNKLFFFHPDDYQFRPYRYNDILQRYAHDEVINDLAIENDGTLHLSYLNYENLLTIDSSGTVLDTISVSIEYDQRFVYELKENGVGFGYIEYKRGKFECKLKNAKGTTLDLGKLESGFYRECHINNVVVFAHQKETHIIKNNSSLAIHHKHRVIGVGKFDEEHLWVGLMSGGIEIYTLEGEYVRTFLNNHSVVYFLRDHQNGYWFSTLDHGVYYAIPNVTAVNSFNQIHIRSLSKASKEQLFVETIHADLYIGIKDSFKRINGENDNSNQKFGFYNSLAGIDSWILNDTLLFNDRKINVSGTRCRSQSIDKPILLGGMIIICQQGERFTYLPITQKTNAVSWAEKGIFLGTHKGLFLLDTATQEISKLPQEELNIRIQSIVQQNDSCWFVGTMGNGIIQLKNGTASQITTKDGLSSDLINSVLVENDSVIWVATNEGLNRVLFRSSGYQIDVLNRSHGLTDNDITEVVIINDTLWVGTRTGLSVVPVSILAQNEQETTLFLKWTDFLVGDNFVAKEAFLDLGYHQNNLTFHYHAVDFKANGRLRYRYLLKGLETTWNHTAESKLHYASIPPGNYTLLLQASINSKNWEQHQLEMPIKIWPPFYKTWWFIFLCIVLGVALIYYFFKIRVLSYNRDIVRELLRQVLKRFTPETNSFIVVEQGRSIKINSDEVLYVHSTGNYLTIRTSSNKHVIRCKIGKFVDLVPDKLEYLRVNRSYVVRIDKITEKSTKSLTINGEEIPVGVTYQKFVAKLEL